VRYWLPLIAAFALLVAATKVPAILSFIFIIVAFGLVIEVSTKMLENSGGTGGLNNHRQ
jgi:hypothetical protein